jgi:hypothetical protein
MLMLSLSDQQMQAIKAAAVDVPQEKRSLYLERIAAMLSARRPFSDSDVDDVAKLATCSLVHEHTDAAGKGLIDKRTFLQGFASTLVADHSGGNWHHISGVRRNNVLRHYFDGKEVGEIKVLKEIEEVAKLRSAICPRNADFTLDAWIELDGESVESIDDVEFRCYPEGIKESPRN